MDLALGGRGRVKAIGRPLAQITPDYPRLPQITTRQTPQITPDYHPPATAITSHYVAIAHH